MVNPCQEEPGHHFRFVYDEVTRIASVYGTTERGRTTERIVGLNREDLRRERSRQVGRLAALARLAKDDPEAADLLAEARADRAAYAAFARSLRDP